MWSIGEYILAIFIAALVALLYTMYMGVVHVGPRAHLPDPIAYCYSPVDGYYRPCRHMKLFADI